VCLRGVPLDAAAGHLRIDSLDDVRLTFFQKATLLPNERTAAALVKPGILHLNRIRNRFGHSLGADLSVQDLSSINPVLDLARPGVAFGSPMDAIEAFSTVACTFLIVPPPALQGIFTEAFSSVRLRVEIGRASCRERV